MQLKSNEPFWLVKNGIKEAYPSLRTNCSTDILIVGGGITGALMAHSCMGKGFQTCLIDKREIANGSTSATTAMLQYEIDVPLFKLIKLIGREGALACYRACCEAIGQLHALSREIKSDSGFEKKQSLYFASKKKDLKWLKTEFEQRKAGGFEVEWLTKEYLWDKYGLMAEGGILSAAGASVDAFCFTHDLLRHNRQRGLKVFDKTALQKVIYEPGGVKAYLDTGAVIVAKKIIYCTGYESVSLLPEKVVKLKSTYAIISECMENLNPDLAGILCWNTDSPYLYMRSTTDNRMLMGGGDEDFKNALKRDALLDLKAAKLAKAFHELLPGSRFITDFSWCGTFGETKDGLPYIGEHRKFPDSYFCLGFGGNGITFSLIGARLITWLMQGKTDPLAHWFRFGR